MLDTEKINNLVEDILEKEPGLNTAEPTYRDILKIIYSVATAYDENNAKAIDILGEAINKLYDRMELERTKDRLFFMSILPQMLSVNKEKLFDAYTDWCEGFYEVNKERYDSLRMKSREEMKNF